MHKIIALSSDTIIFNVFRVNSIDVLNLNISLNIGFEGAVNCFDVALNNPDTCMHVRKVSEALNDARVPLISLNFPVSIIADKWRNKVKIGSDNDYMVGLNYYNCPGF